MSKKFNLNDRKIAIDAVYDDNDQTAANDINDYNRAMRNNRVAITFENNDDFITEEPISKMEIEPDWFDDSEVPYYRSGVTMIKPVGKDDYMPENPAYARIELMMHDELWAQENAYDDGSYEEYQPMTPQNKIYLVVEKGRHLTNVRKIYSPEQITVFRLDKNNKLVIEEQHSAAPDKITWFNPYLLQKIFSSIQGENDAESEYLFNLMRAIKDIR